MEVILDKRLHNNQSNDSIFIEKIFYAIHLNDGSRQDDKCLNSCQF